MTPGDGQSINSEVSGANRGGFHRGRQRGACLTASNPMNQFQAGRFRGAAECALPDNANPPTGVRKSSDCLQVPGLVAAELLVPEITAGLGKPEEWAAFMPVPETAVDENNRTPTFQRQVWLAGQASRVEPETQTGPP